MIMAHVIMATEVRKAHHGPTDNRVATLTWLGDQDNIAASGSLPGVVLFLLRMRVALSQIAARVGLEYSFRYINRYAIFLSYLGLSGRRSIFYMCFCVRPDCHQ